MTRDAGAADRRLDGWKRIADYLQTTVRTAQRWEQELGLPVHRVQRRTREAVHAFTSELDTWLQNSRSVSAPIHHAIAVLPFACAHGHWLGEAFADELISSFSSIRGLRTIARTSSFPLARMPVPEIAAALGIHFLVEGELQRDSFQLRVRVRVVNPRGTVLWAESIDSQGESLLGLQREVAMAVASHLRMRLEPLRLARPVPHELYETFLRARVSFYRMTPESVQQAMGLVTECLRQQPDFAQAQADLGAMYLQLAMLGSTDPAPSILAARRCLQHALSLDAKLPVANLWMARILSLHDYQWADAERLYRKTLVDEPGHPTAPYLFGSDFLRVVGRYEDSLQFLGQSAQADPLNPMPHLGMALAFAATGKDTEALAAGERAHSLVPDHWVTQWLLGVLYLRRGDAGQALAWLDKAAVAAPAFGWVRPARANALRLAGEETAARRLLEESVAARATAYVPPTTLALLHALFGETDAAFGWFEQALEERDAVLPYLPHGNRGVFLRQEAEQPIRQDPRWAGLVRRMNLDVSPSGTAK